MQAGSPRSFDFQLRLSSIYENRNYLFKEMYKVWNKLKNKINQAFALTCNMQKNNANEFEIYTFQRFQT